MNLALIGRNSGFAGEQQAFGGDSRFGCFAVKIPAGNKPLVYLSGTLPGIDPSEGRLLVADQRSKGAPLESPPSYYPKQTLLTLALVVLCAPV